VKIEWILLFSFMRESKPSPFSRALVHRSFFEPHFFLLLHSSPKAGTSDRRENTRSHSDLDMWNRLAPYVLRLFGRHGPSPLNKERRDQTAYSFLWFSPELLAKSRKCKMQEKLHWDFFGLHYERYNKGLIKERIFSSSSLSFFFFCIQKCGEGV